jgi:hypothetical protein
MPSGAVRHDIDALSPSNTRDALSTQASGPRPRACTLLLFSVRGSQCLADDGVRKLQQHVCKIGHSVLSGYPYMTLCIYPPAHVCRPSILSNMRGRWPGGACVRRFFFAGMVHARSGAEERGSLLVRSL